MKQLITVILFFYCYSLYSQENNIPIRLFKEEQIIKGPFKVVFINQDTTYSQNTEHVRSSDLNYYSIRICFNEYGILIPKRNDQIYSMDIYLNRKTYRKKLGETRFGIGSIIKRYYYIDIGIDVILRISRSNKKHRKSELNG